MAVTMKINGEYVHDVSLSASERPFGVHEQAEFVKAVVQLATENPDFVYPRNPDQAPACLYVRDGEGSCIIGQAFVRIGFPVEEVAEFDLCATSFVGKILEELGVEYGSPLSDWAINIQGQQDEGTMWSDALRYADERFGRPEFNLSKDGK